MMTFCRRRADGNDFGDELVDLDQAEEGRGEEEEEEEGREQAEELVPEVERNQPTDSN